MQEVEPEHLGFVSVQQAARFLGIHRSSLYQAIAAGKLETVRVMGRTALRWQDVQAYRPRTYRDRRAQGARPRPSAGISNDWH